MLGEENEEQRKEEEDSLPLEFPNNEDKQMAELNNFISSQLAPIRAKLDEVTKQMNTTESLEDIKKDVSTLKTQMQAQEEEPEDWDKKIVQL
jgi:hypothetical protein